VGTAGELAGAVVAGAVAARGEDCGGCALHADDAFEGVAHGVVVGICELQFCGEEQVGLLELELLVLEGLYGSLAVVHVGAHLLFLELQRADGGAELVHFELLVVFGCTEGDGELFDDAVLSPLRFVDYFDEDALGVEAEFVGPVLALLEACVDVDEGGLRPLLETEHLDGHLVLVLGVCGLEHGHVCEEGVDVLDFEAPERRQVRW
jgi:hypothetical protein